MDETITKTIEKFFFRAKDTGKYYIVGAYSEEHAWEMMGNLKDNVKFTLESVEEDAVPDTDIA
jgi:hypothetical protein